MTKNKFTPTKSNLWAIRLGFWAGQGCSSVDIARLLEDGTGPATVRTMIQRAELPLVGEKKVVVPIILPTWQRDILAKHARKHEIELIEYCTRLIYDAGIADDLYIALTDGRYD